MEIARLELARIQLQLLKSDSDSTGGDSHYSQPLQTVEPLLTSSDTAIRIAGLGLRGEIQMAARDWISAIDDLSVALEAQPEVQWYLWRAEAQQQTGQYLACVAGLRIADARTQSPVITSALCDALIEAITLCSLGCATNRDDSRSDIRHQCGTEYVAIEKCMADTPR